MKAFFYTLLFLITTLTLQAETRLVSLFCDHMVLQQKTNNAIWGYADPGEKISITASWGSKANATANADGKWKAFLKTPGHGTGHSLTVSGANTLTLKDVAIGEVWLCAGQSNMGWSMGNSFEAEKEAKVDLPNFRIFKSQREHWQHPLDESRDRLARWKPCDPQSAAETSAVSYYFGKKLHQELGIPVGIIQQAFAGTPIEGWMPWDIQKHNTRSKTHKKELDATIERQLGRMGIKPTESLATFEKELAAYNAQIDAGETMKNKFKVLSPPIITKPASLGHQYPSHIFNAMIHPIRPYGIRGAIWYQGERNAKNVPQAADYREQLALMIDYYRSSWHELSNGNVADDFPFQLTQLPSWNPPQVEPVEGLEASWAVSRESMRLASQEIANTHLAVTIDTGDAIALHPKNKKPIGLRHAYLALENTYGKKLVGSGPRLKDQSIKGSQLILDFDSTGRGLMTAKPGPLGGFAIAGADRKWHWAEAKINGNQVILTSQAVSKPIAARYAWAMNPSQRNLLYNKEGLPASPFRTDDWALFKKDDEIVTVLKPKKPEDGSKTERDWERPQMTQ